MITLETLNQMIAVNKANRSAYGTPAPKKIIAFSNPEARYKSLRSSARNGGLTLGGKFKTLTGFSDWLEQFDPAALEYEWCITCKCFDPNETVLTEQTAWIIPRWCLNYLTVRAGRKTVAIGVRPIDGGRYQAINKGLYHGSFASVSEAHQAWLNNCAATLDQLLVENAKINDLVTAARIKEIADGMRECISTKKQLKQHAVSNLDHAALKQQYFNSLKETKQ
jgi:hypothetical protein